MKKTLLFSTAFLISAILTGQVIEFSGSWKLNSSKSKLNYDFSMAPLEMKITQKGNDMSLERHYNFQGEVYVSTDKLTLDGKECVNPGWMDSQKKSVCAWSEDKKSLKITSKFPMDDGSEVTIVEVYKMDGKAMVVDTSATSSYGELVETSVYDKQ